VEEAVVAARTDERVVIASGADAAADALSGEDRLGDSETYAQVKSVLGDDMEPGSLVSMPALLELVSSHAAGDEEFAKVKPYLEAFGVVASGSETEGGRAHARAAAALK